MVDLNQVFQQLNKTLEYGPNCEIQKVNPEIIQNRMSHLPFLSFIYTVFLQQNKELDV